MKTLLNRRRILYVLTIVAVATLVLTFQLTPGLAQVPGFCSGDPLLDADGDGLTDGEECNGIIIPMGDLLPPCDGTENMIDRALCLDPRTPDVGYILVPAITGPSLLPATADLFACLTSSVANGGLGLVVHQIDQEQAGPGFGGRELTPTQPALRMFESLNENGVKLGSCTQGIADDDCTIFTKRIVNFLTDEVYGEAPPPAIQAAYTTQIFCHESGHGFSLTKEFDNRVGGNHLNTREKVIMSQTVSYKAKGGNVDFSGLTLEWDALSTEDFILTP